MIDNVRVPTGIEDQLTADPLLTWTRATGSVQNEEEQAGNDEKRILLDSRVCEEHRKRWILADAQISTLI